MRDEIRDFIHREIQTYLITSLSGILTTQTLSPHSIDLMSSIRIISNSIK